MKKNILFITFIFLGSSLLAQQKKRVLFIGNSYVAVNNLPQLTHDLALSANDTIEFDSYTPGGYTLAMHFADVNCVQKISLGNWDFVALQEQSQTPAFDPAYVDANFYPYAKKMDSLIKANNPCAETIFYMTWGRKNGDTSNCAAWPPICTYLGMDSMLRERYEIAADSNDAIIAPVGPLWRHLRQNAPLIELYQTDGSHPSVAGSYAAACCFYTSIFRKNPANLTFNSLLSAADASTIRNAAKLIAFDSLLTWHIGEYDPSANFNFVINAGNVTFTNLSSNATTYKWYFGDGDSSSLANPNHNYSTLGTFTVKLIASSCNNNDTIQMNVLVNSLGLENDVTNTQPSITCTRGQSQFSVYHFEAKKVTCINSLGQSFNPVFSSRDDRTIIEIEHIPSGYYILHLESKDKVFAQPFIK